MGDLYLDINKETDDDCWLMSVDSAVTLFVFKFCEADQHLTPHFVTVRMLFCTFVFFNTGKKIRQYCRGTKHQISVIGWFDGVCWSFRRTTYPWCQGIFTHCKTRCL